MGPGEKLVLITSDKKALFAWRKNTYRQDGQKGIECSIFRNEGCFPSSLLIETAVKLAREKWGSTARLFTYVNPSAIKSTTPSYCFLKAGWTKYDEMAMNGIQMHFYRKPKRFGGLKTSLY